MRYRALDINGDYTFGRGALNYLVNSPDMVRQSIQTRLALFQGEWFLDLTDGTPWYQRILVKGATTYDLLIQTRVLQTAGVQSIVDYSSNLDTVTRSLSIEMLVQTIYSATPVQVEQTFS